MLACVCIPPPADSAPIIDPGEVDVVTLDRAGPSIDAADIDIDIDVTRRRVDIDGLDESLFVLPNTMMPLGERIPPPEPGEAEAEGEEKAALPACNG
jgi:hypothetical protein